MPAGRTLLPPFCLPDKTCKFSPKWFWWKQKNANDFFFGYNIRLSKMVVKESGILQMKS
jgi:hypothetical protein